MENEPINQAPTSSATPPSHVLRNVVIILMIGLLAFLGWWSYNNVIKDSTATNQEQETVTTNVPEVTKQSDLTSAEQFMTDAQIDNQLDTAEIDDVLN